MKSRTNHLLPPHGFALVVTVSLLALLSLIALGFLSLSAVTLRSGTREQAMAEARANARVALMLALGELQKHAGPDQRVTGSGSLAGDGARNPHWTGVWSTVDKNTLPVWLVSGNEAGAPANLDEFATYPASYFTPMDELGPNSVILHSDPDSARQVSVPTVPVKSGDSIVGRYAWWIADEGTKARVDVAPPASAPVNDNERIARSNSPQENGIQQLDPILEKLSPLAEPQDKIDKRRMVSTNTVDLLDAGNNGDSLSRKFFHDLTTGGYGLPVNVATGGMKTDLSIAFDSSQNTQQYDRYIMGATPSLLPVTTTQRNPAVWRFGTNANAYASVVQPEVFFLSPELSNNGTLQVGPNWGNIYNYCQLWRNIQTNGSIRSLVMHPSVNSDMRTNTWAPYRRHRINLDNGSSRTDFQHTNSAVHPVLSMIQIGFRVASIRTGTSPDFTYSLQLHFKPVIGLWNPHNIPIANTHYGFRWGLFPYLRLGIETPDGKEYEYSKWLRQDWPKFGEGDRIWECSTAEQINFQPGEIRLLSIGTRPSGDLYQIGGTGSINALKPGWHQNGYFRTPIPILDAGGGSITLPQGTKVWCKELMLLDVQNPKTWAEVEGWFDDAKTKPWIADGNAGSFFALSSGGLDVHRITDLWQTPLKAVYPQLPYLVPEPIRESDSFPKKNIEDIRWIQNSSFSNPMEIGTWRFFIRNANDAMDPQKLRGWVDANPRHALANPRWDGSRPVGDDGYEGWQFPGMFTGHISDIEPTDGGPADRGKVIGPPEPDITGEAERYRGFGGLSTSSGSGQNQVPVFDVPRGPLVSLGQLQHAELSRYQYEPALPFGSSYANPRIPLDRTVVENCMETPNFNMVDISHGLNRALWDNFFFSTVGRDFMVPPSTTSSLDEVLNFADLAVGERSLPNPRYTVRPQPGDTTFQEILTKANTANVDGDAATVRKEAPRALAARIGIEGAFNVNSTSVEAWKAVISSMADLEFPLVASNGSVSWANPDGIRLPRFGHALSPGGWQTGDDPTSSTFWQGYRKLTNEEASTLAKEIVKEVRERGPFRSFADFVNRDPDSSSTAHQHKGALQAALDRAINSTLDGEIGTGVPAPPKGLQFHAVHDQESTAAGFAGYLMQGDVLQSLAPILHVRSDSFRIRTVGQSLDHNGNVVARAYCEAFVQRVADYVDPNEQPEKVPARLTSTLNQRYGRRYEIVSFRWLAQDEI